MHAQLRHAWDMSAHVHIYIYMWQFLFCSLTLDALAEVAYILAVQAHSMNMDMPWHACQGMPWWHAMACQGMPWHAMAYLGMPWRAKAGQGMLWHDHGHAHGARV